MTFCYSHLTDAKSRADVFRLPRHVLIRDRLHRLICNFEHWVGLTDGESSARQRLVTGLTRQLRKNVLNVDFKPFGSVTTNLATPLSDIDIGFNVTNGRFEMTGASRTKKAQVKKLHLIHRYLHKFKSIEKQHVRDRARVPVLTLQHGPSKTDIQIVASVNGVPKTLQIQSWLDEFPQARSIYLLVKTALEVRGLTEPVTGGLGSYTLICMVVAFFRLSGNVKRDDLGSTLWEFLDFYAHFNTRTSCLSVEPTFVFKKRAQHNVTQATDLKDVAQDNELTDSQQQLAVANKAHPWLLCIQDPTDLWNDLGKPTTRIMDIRMTFRVLSQRLRSWLAGSTERQTEDPLMPFFGKMLGHVRDRRRHFLRWTRLPTTRHVQLGTSLNHANTTSSLPPSEEESTFSPPDANPARKSIPQRSCPSQDVK